MEFGDLQFKPDALHRLYVKTPVKVYGNLNNLPSDKYLFFPDLHLSTESIYWSKKTHSLQRYKTDTDCFFS